VDLYLLESLAKKEYSKINSSHDWEHIIRVKNNAELIGEQESADLDVVVSAAILHDLGRLSKEKNHSNDTKLADLLLSKVKCESKKRADIIDCIKSHSFDSKEKPKSLESKILFDADKIDSYGFIGVSRFFMLSGEKNNFFRNSVEKAFQRIVKLEEVSGFYTVAGKKLGFKKARRGIVFYYLLLKELGEKEKAQEIRKIVEKHVGGFKSKLFFFVVESFL